MEMSHLGLDWTGADMNCSTVTMRYFILYSFVVTYGMWLVGVQITLTNVSHDIRRRDRQMRALVEHHLMTELTSLTANIVRRNVPNSTANIVRQNVPNSTANIVPNNLPKTVCQMAIAKTEVPTNSTEPSWEALESQVTVLGTGGHFKPENCLARQKIAIIVPYRNREEHLKLFLQHMHPFLQTQKLEYTLYIVELEPNVIFKKGLLMNAGFLEITKRTKADCYIFHDIDMLPMNTGVSYACVKGSVTHPAEFVRQYNFRNYYNKYMGGVLMFEETSFRKVNGFSNLYWGWGGEDDDMFHRVKEKKIPIKRVTDKSLRFWSWAHSREDEFQNRAQFIAKAVERMNKEGLNSADYHVISIEERPLYTWIYVSANQTDGSFHGMKQKYVINKRIEEVRNDIKTNVQNVKTNVHYTYTRNEHRINRKYDYTRNERLSIMPLKARRARVGKRT